MNWGRSAAVVKIGYFMVIIVIFYKNEAVRDKSYVLTSDSC